MNDQLKKIDDEKERIETTCGCVVIVALLLIGAAFVGWIFKAIFQ